jgi:hypothetical protein
MLVLYLHDRLLTFIDSRIVNLGVGVFMVLGGIGQFFPSIGMYVNLRSAHHCLAHAYTIQEEDWRNPVRSHLVLAERNGDEWQESSNGKHLYVREWC